jgi:D-alanyl-D-alanine carboxypeptidase
MGKYIQTEIEAYSSNKNYTRYFVGEMNALAREMGLSRTLFDNPHGLSNPNNRSCASDLGRLASICMRNSHFREIVRAKSYICYVFQPNEPNIYRKVKWVNTNKLLDDGWEGVKTGITQTAGPCLSACCRVSDNVTLIVTTLNSRSTEARWSDVIQLANWAVSSLQLSPFCE